MNKTGNPQLDAEIEQYEGGQIDLLTLLTRAEKLRQITDVIGTDDFWQIISEFEGLDEPFAYIKLEAVGQSARVSVNDAIVWSGSLVEAEEHYEDEISKYYARRRMEAKKRFSNQ